MVCPDILTFVETLLLSFTESHTQKEVGSSYRQALESFLEPASSTNLFLSLDLMSIKSLLGQQLMGGSV